MSFDIHSKEYDLEPSVAKVKDTIARLMDYSQSSTVALNSSKTKAWFSLVTQAQEHLFHCENGPDASMSTSTSARIKIFPFPCACTYSYVGFHLT